MEDLKLKKDRECLKCERFFDCRGKPEYVKNCINFKDRKDLRKEER